jgi:peptidoglycan/xylan/chitin deacetylase (PgdA/CDA1 family)
MISAGMDHDLYPFSALPDRAPFALPEGKAVAFCPVVYLEDWTLTPPEGAHNDPRFGDPYGSFRPDYRTHTWREYGLRIGIFRLFEVFDRYGLTATLAVNSNVARRCPNLIEAAQQRGWDIAAHGEYANAMITGAQSEADVRAHIRDCRQTLTEVSGKRPAGWISQDFGHSANTPQILAEEGVDWIADWPNDEQPYRLQTDPAILSIPVMSELDDVQMLWHRRVATSTYPRLIREAYDVMCRDSAEGARVLVLGVHAWLLGMPHRIRYFDQTIAELAQQETAWNATLGQLADWCGSGKSEGILK